MQKNLLYSSTHSWDKADSHFGITLGNALAYLTTRTSNDWMKLLLLSMSNHIQKFNFIPQLKKVRKPVVLSNSKKIIKNQVKRYICPYKWVHFLPKPQKPHFRAILKKFLGPPCLTRHFPPNRVSSVFSICGYLTLCKKNPKKLMSKFRDLALRTDKWTDE